MSQYNVHLFLASALSNDYQPVIDYVGGMGESLGRPITAQLYLSLVHAKCNAGLVGGLAGHAMTMQEWSHGGGCVTNARMREHDLPSDVMRKRPCEMRGTSCNNRFRVYLAVVPRKLWQICSEQ
jgi:hypothetical protein